MTAFLPLAIALLHTAAAFPSVPGVSLRSEHGSLEKRDCPTGQAHIPVASSPCSPCSPGERCPDGTNWYNCYFGTYQPRMNSLQCQMGILTHIVQSRVKPAAYPHRQAHTLKEPPPSIRSAPLEQLSLTLANTLASLVQLELTKPKRVKPLAPFAPQELPDLARAKPPQAPASLVQLANSRISKFQLMPAVKKRVNPLVPPRRQAFITMLPAVTPRFLAPSISTNLYMPSMWWSSPSKILTNMYPQAGQTSCLNCPAGQYQNLTGQSSCSTTPAGFYSAAGASAPVPCPSGFYQSLSGRTSCPNVTPAGSYNSANVNGSSSPIPCVAGTYQPSAGQSACLPAPLGFYTKNVAGSTTVIACSSGQYQNQTGQTSCQTTPVGFYNNGTSAGSPAPIPCPAGSYQSYTGQNFCYGAPKGRFQSMSGQAGVCGTCCGWAAPLTNNNINPVNCTGSTPNAWPGSGDGCISSSTSCIHTATCVQDPVTGACPASTYYG
ncbi:hypothetical protein B0H17DRAFT_1143909 [Mycena rosella]|uniref:Tyrosine-protein kinase ephrin type A/B receptor-like domain-containing protein n=1 Tax=Mycena rosella TaxID=1033263 RepID=A0AAD7G688_MYCRO|nr:hypothetical protein B0H17DRAFT_1143909 [Mycena rosella]